MTNFIEWVTYFVIDGYMLIDKQISWFETPLLEEINLFSLKKFEHSVM